MTKPEGNFKLWALVITLIITLSISIGIVWYNQSNKGSEFKYEIYDKVEDIEPPPVDNKSENIPPSKDDSRANIKRVAIIIDDLGWNKESADALLNIEAPISFAILPHLPFSKIIADEAGLKHRDVLLHLPMEPYGYPHKDPGRQKHQAVGIAQIRDAPRRKVRGKGPFHYDTQLGNTASQDYRDH